MKRYFFVRKILWSTKMKTYQLLPHSVQGYSQYLNHQSSHKGNAHRSVATYGNVVITEGMDKAITEVFGDKIQNILAVGCRSQVEINFLQNFAQEVKGVDLYTSFDTPQIIASDMHLIGEVFKEKEFEIIYSSHSLEHSARPDDLLVAMKKVSKKGGVFIVPPTAETDPGPTIGHPLWVWCLHRDRFTVSNIQIFIDELCGKGFATVKYCEIIDSSNYSFCLEW